MLIIKRKQLIWSELLSRETLVVPSPSLPACSAAPPGRILDIMLSPSMPGWPAAALPIPPGLGAALEPWQGREEKRMGVMKGQQTDRERMKCLHWFLYIDIFGVKCCHCVIWWHPPKIPCKSQWAVDIMLYPSVASVAIQWDPVSYLSHCFATDEPLPVSV